MDSRKVNRSYGEVGAGINLVGLIACRKTYNVVLPLGRKFGKALAVGVEEFVEAPGIYSRVAVGAGRTHAEIELGERNVAFGGAHSQRYRAAAACNGCKAARTLFEYLANLVGNGGIRRDGVVRYGEIRFFADIDAVGVSRYGIGYIGPVEVLENDVVARVENVVLRCLVGRCGESYARRERARHHYREGRYEKLS